MSSLSRKGKIKTCSTFDDDDVVLVLSPNGPMKSLKVKPTVSV